MPGVVPAASFKEKGSLAVPKTSYLPTRSDMATKKRKIICFSGKRIRHLQPHCKELLTNPTRFRWDYLHARHGTYTLRRPRLWKQTARDP